MADVGRLSDSVATRVTPDGGNGNSVVTGIRAGAEDASETQKY